MVDFKKLKIRAKTSKKPSPATLNLENDAVVVKEEKKMPGFTVNLAGVSTSNIIDEGDYEVTLTKATPRKSNNGNQTVNFEFTVTGDDTPDQKGRKVFTTYTLTTESLWAFKKYLRILGADPDELEGDIDVMEFVQSLYGNKALAIVTVEPDRQNAAVMLNRTRIRELPLD